MSPDMDENAVSLRKVRRNARRPIVIATLLVFLAGPSIAQDMKRQEPANVGDAKIAATEYYKSGAYQREVAAVIAQARSWIRERAPQVSKPAIVLDIDDTALTNWQVIQANDFGRVFGGPCRELPKGPCGWVAWDLRARIPALMPTRELFKEARAAKVEVFFISGRDEPQRAATRINLRSQGYGDYRGLYMPAKAQHFASAADFKAPQRQKIEAAGYTIIANIGDQPSDLAGGHAERTYLLPNPFYRIP